MRRKTFEETICPIFAFACDQDEAKVQDESSTCEAEETLEKDLHEGAKTNVHAESEDDEVQSLPDYEREVQREIDAEVSPGEVLLSILFSAALSNFGIKLTFDYLCS